MTAITNTTYRTEPKSYDQQSRMPFWSQVLAMTWRNLLIVMRTPAAVVPGMIISVFFLIVYEASLGGAADFLPGLSGSKYLAFILPLSIISASLSGAGVAGQNIVRDIESGYFDKLLLTPINRIALLSGSVIAGGIILCIQAMLIIAIALLMGLQPETGLGGIIAVVGFALLIGMAFSGFSVGVAVRTGNAAATQGASFLFFPLTFLTATFVPITLLDGWIRVAATYNPITYVLDAMRDILLNGWDQEIIIRGVSACLAMGVVMLIFAIVNLRSRFTRK